MNTSGQDICPLLTYARSKGLNYLDSNTTEPTRQPSYWFPKMKTQSRLDWFFTRGLVIGNPTVVPANWNGQGLSDH